MLDKTYAEQPNFEGAKYVMSPPLRDKRNQPVLWNGLRERLIADASPPITRRSISRRRSRWAKDDFTKIPNGIPSLEDRVNLLYTHGVKTGQIDLHTFVERREHAGREALRSVPAQRHDPARRATPTSWSSIPNYRGKISAKTQHMNVDYSAFEGWKIEGRPSVVTVRGEVAARDGKFVGEIGRGQFLQREPSHF